MNWYSPSYGQGTRAPIGKILMQRAVSNGCSTAASHVRNTSFLLIFYTLVFAFSIPQTASAKTLLYRNNNLTLPVDVSGLSEFSVMFDDLDATEFATMVEDGVEFLIPFPEKRSSFKVSVLGGRGGDILFEQTYRRARSNEVFDLIDFAASAQLDAAVVSISESGAFTPDDDGSLDAQSDLLATVSLSGARDGLVSSLELEAVNRSNRDETLRPNGPGTDIGRFAFSTDYTNQTGNRLYVNAGDTQMTAANTLVNNGMLSRGLVAGWQTADQRLNVELGRFYGTDIVGAVGGPIGWSSDSYRTNANAAFNVVNEKNFSWSMHASVLDVKRPGEDSFGIGQTPEGETNSVRGFGSDFGFYDNRARINLAWASSRYDNPESVSPVDTRLDDDFTVFRPGESTGSAWRHGVSWDVWQGEVEGLTTSLGFELTAESASPLYHSVQGVATADRRQRSAAINAAHGVLDVRLDSTRFRNNLHDLISIHTLEESVHNATVSVDLASLKYNATDESVAQAASADDAQFSIDSMDATSLEWLIPSSVSASVQIQDVKTLNGEDIILAPVIEGLDFMNQTTTTLGLSASWEGVNNSTTLEISDTSLDIDQRERAAADRRDTYYGLTHSIQNDRWTLSGRLGLTDTDDLDPISRSANTLFDWGFSGSVSTAHGVNFSASFDTTQSRLNDLVIGDKTTSLSTRYGFSINFGDWLGRKLNLKTSPSVTAAWHKTAIEEDGPFFNSEMSAASTTLNIGVTY